MALMALPRHEGATSETSEIQSASTEIKRSYLPLFVLYSQYLHGSQFNSNVVAPLKKKKKKKKTTSGGPLSNPNLLSFVFLFVKCLVFIASFIRFTGR